VREYWDQAISQDSQRHAADLIVSKGIPGMVEYWGHTLDHEAAGYHCTATDTVYRIDMHQCPSKGFLIRKACSSTTTTATTVWAGWGRSCAAPALWWITKQPRRPVLV